MKRIFPVFLALAVVVCFIQLSCKHEHGGREHAGKEHGGKEHGGKEHGGKEHGDVSIQEPSNQAVRGAMKAYVEKMSSETGNFEVFDKETGSRRRLSLVRIHDRVGKTGNYYYSCADFKDIDTGELIDIDIDVEFEEGELEVEDVRIHKVEGKRRYTYDKNDNRILVDK